MSSSPPVYFTFKIQWEENKAIRVTNFLQFGKKRRYDLLNWICGNVYNEDFASGQGLTFGDI